MTEADQRVMSFAAEDPRMGLERYLHTPFSNVGGSKNIVLKHTVTCKHDWSPTFLNDRNESLPKTSVALVKHINFFNKNEGLFDFWFISLGNRNERDRSIKSRGDVDFLIIVVIIVR